MDVYVRKVLRVSVAQICQTIGYNSFQSIPLELLVDSLQKFLQEFARDLHRHVELFNRTEANLDDVALSLQSLNISVGDLLEYINHVQPVSCNIEIPQLPAPKTSNLNFLKPGSKEVLTRPVHIYEHLPPILRDNDDVDDKSNIALASPNSGQANISIASNNSNEITDEVDRKMTGQQLSELNNDASLPPSAIPANSNLPIDLQIGTKSTIPSSATREISSVMMTSGGFISPAIEGKTPESLIPDIVDKYFGLDAPRSATPVPPPTTPAATPSTAPASNSTPNNNQDTAPSSKSTKTNQNAEKKTLKKVKKKNLSGLPPNLLGSGPNPLNDKAQRKRFKMLQKSMAKNNAGGSNGAIKTKNHNNMSHASQEKHLKKQFKLKQKQIRQKSNQKHLEIALDAIPLGAGASLNRGPPGLVPILPPDIDKFKVKNEFTSLPPPPLTLPKEHPPLPLSEAESSTPVFGSLPFPHPNKNMFHQQQPMAGSQMDLKLNNPLMPMSQQTAPPMTLSPMTQYDEIKLNNEPDRSKLNIFKKISSSGRKERAEGGTGANQPGVAPPGVIQHPETKAGASASANTTIFGDSQVISLPSGTTITPAPPSGSGRHVYAPPPSSQQSGDFSSVITVDDSGGIPEGSAVLMQRGDLMIQKPKKRGRKPGSKNQPKILGLTTKKAKKIKKSFFGHHSAANLMEPLNLSHNSIDNIANIPLGIASTFPIDAGVGMKMKKERKKSKMGKDSGFMHNHSKSSSTSGGGRNLAPTKEEFATINQKLMMMDTVLQAAPPLPSGTSLSIPNKPRTGSPSFAPGSLPNDPVDSAMRAKKEKRKAKQLKDQQKQIMQQASNPFGSHNTMPHGPPGRRSPSPFNAPPNFPNVPGMEGMPMFPFYPFPARPGLIPSHNLFSQLPNMHNNGLFMPPLMGFPPLNSSIRSYLKDEKMNPLPLPLAPEGNYSKVASLVPDTMKLELSPGAGSSKMKNISPRGSGFTQEPSNIGLSMMTAGNTSIIRKKPDEHPQAATSAAVNLNILKNSADVTIEVSSDDSVQDEVRNPPSTAFTNRGPALPLTGMPQGLYRPSKTDLTINNDEMNVVEDMGRSSSAERRNKEHKKVKKVGKQNKKQSPSSALPEFKNPSRLEAAGSGGDAMDISSESGKKHEDSANSSGHTVFEFESSPERRKDHKKMKKLLKETKIKKKKDKKDKNKNKERSMEKIVKSEKTEKEKRKEEKKDKIKKLKKDKKKGKDEKDRVDGDAGGSVKYTSSGGEGGGSANEVTSIIPKITLKLGQAAQSPTSVKSGNKSSLMSVGAFNPSERELSPELARISPLVTRPPKQHKSGPEDVGNSIGIINSSSAAAQASHQTPSLSASLNILGDSVIDIDSNSGPSTYMLPASATILGGLGMPQTSSISKSPANSGTTTFHNPSGSTTQHQHASSTSKHSSSMSLISEANRPTSYVDTSTKDAEGNRVWICPACGKVDDGSPMIGCDGCDAWYHWVCVGILVAPEDNEDWYCRVCIAKKRGVHGGDKKRKRNKKKNTADF